MSVEIAVKMSRTRGLWAKALLAAGACLAAAAIAAPAAQAEFGLAAADASTSLGGSTTIIAQFSRQAGAHADLTTQVVFNGFEQAADESPRTIEVNLPPGLIGNPTAAPTCTPRELTAGAQGQSSICPLVSQVGIVYRKNETTESDSNASQYPLYNMEHPADIPGLFAFNFAGNIVRIEPRVRGADYGISASSPSLSQALQLHLLKVVVWGVPADTSHDPDRFIGDSGDGINIQGNRPSTPSPALRLPFLTNPTSCEPTPSPFVAESDSWQDPGVFSRISFNTDFDGTPFVWKGCERVPFHPAITVYAGTHRAASPSGLDVDIKVPQSEDPYGLASAHVRKVVTVFPRGVVASPSAVAGLGACSMAEINLGSNEPPTCPDSSKIGNLTIRTQLLESPLEGEVVLARQSENPFHSLFAIYLVAKGPGFYLKIPGELNVDKQTGQLKTVFEDLPQQPFEEAHLDFRGGPTAPLQTPDTCGTYQTHTELTSWADPTPVVIEAPMVIDENCTGGGTFNPTLQAGVANPVAGANSPLTLRIRRLDGEQNISRLDVTLPEGELAKLAGVAVCGDAQAAIGSCPAASQVGISTTAIGTGAFPLFVPQPGKDPTALYLGGPYKGAPYSLITKVPAQSGPFDFGTIVVRTAIDVDPITSQVIARSDPLPQILEGVPISYRDVRIEVQKPDFTVNPTSCEQRYVTSTITSTQGAGAHPQVPFKVGDCASLGFAPKLSLGLKGGTNRGDYQALTAILIARKGDANIGRVTVALPHSEFLAQEHIRTICTRVQFAAKQCPDRSIYGFARAITPLLDKPLEGPVYLRSSSNPLPDLVASLNGQFNIELAGRIDSVHGGIRNTFDVIPDAPVTKFVLKMQGGDRSLLVNSRNLCKAPSRADVKMIGQNGKRHDFRPLVQNSCAKKSAKAKSKHKRHR